MASGQPMTRDSGIMFAYCLDVQTRLPFLMLVVALLVSACSDAAMLSPELDTRLANDIAQGQTLVFVGTDPISLDSDIYLVHAVASESADDAPDLRDAADFQVEPLEALTAAGPNGSVQQSGSNELFPTEAPFVVPDEQGLRVLATSLGRDEDGTVLGGRLVVVDITPRRHRVSPFILGLTSARFTWAGDWLILQIVDPETGRHRLEAMLVDDIEREDGRIPLGPDVEGYEIEFAESIRDSNAVLARKVERNTAVADILRLDPETGDVAVLTSGTELSAASPRISAEGSLLAVTLQIAGDEELRRTVAVFDIIAGGPPIFEAGDAGVDCGRPAWSPPVATAPASPTLAYACRRLDDGRPDLHLWQSQDASPELSPALTLTSQAQTAVPGGSIDGLVVRAGPLWDPTGRRVVFGASTEEQALEGEGMTILAFELQPEVQFSEQDSLAYSVYPAGFGAADWIHFSAGSAEPILMLWDRAQTGLEDSTGGHPIEVVSVAQDGGLPRAVALGINVRVSHPLFLGRNTLFYP